MKLETTAGALRAALKIVAPAVCRWWGFPVLRCVLFDGATLRATNTDFEISAAVVATSAEGKAVIEHAKLLTLVTHLDPKCDLTIDADETSAKIIFAGGEYRLPCIEVSLFPAPLGDFDAAPMIDVCGLGKAMRMVAPAVSTEETRYYLNGVCLSRRDGKPMVVATDGHRLAACPIPFTVPALDGTIIPYFAVAAMLKMADPLGLQHVDPDKSIGTRRVRFSWPGISLVTKTIDGTFPDWCKVLPKVTPDTPCVRVNRNYLGKALMRLSVAATTENVQTAYSTLAFGSIGCLLYAEVDGGGDGCEHLARASAERAPVPAATTFNSRYMRQVMAMLDGDDIQIDVVEGGGPMRIVASDSGAFVVLMPARGTDAQLRAIEILSARAGASKDAA